MLKLVQDSDTSGLQTPLLDLATELRSLLRILLSYGVCKPPSIKTNLLVDCLSSRRKLHDRMIDSVIDCLSTSFSQISGYVHFTDVESATGALQINGGAVGVSFWLDTPNVNLNSPSALLFTLNFGKSVSIKVELLLDQKQPEAGSDKPKNQIEDENVKGDDLRESDDSSSDMMIEDLNAPVFYL